MRFFHQLTSSLTLCWQRVLVCCLGLALVSCGGGGSGGDGSGASASSTSGFSVSLDRDGISFDYDAYQPPLLAQVINAVAQGPVPDALYVKIDVEGAGISSGIPVYINGTTASASVYADAKDPGTYRGRLLVYVCDDPACAHPIGGTPKAVAYTIKVHTALQVHPPTDVAVVSGQTRTIVVPIDLPDNASGLTVLRAQSYNPVVVGAPGPDGLPITIGGSLHSGRDTVNIDLATTGASQQRTSFSFNYQITPPEGGEHDLIATPNSLTFAAREGQTAPSQSVKLDMPTWGGGQREGLQISYESLPWLSVKPTADGITVSASATSASAGVYRSRIVVVDPASKGAQYIPVSFTVGNDLIAPATFDTSLTSDTTLSQLTWQVPVNTVSGKPISYLVSTDQPWIKLGNTSGYAGDKLTFSLDPVTLVAQSGRSGTAEALVTLSPTDSMTAPVSFGVYVKWNLTATLTILAPQQLVANQPQTVHLRGTGLNTAPNVLKQLKIDDQSLTDVTFADDVIEAHLPALTPGAHTISLTSASGLTLSTLSLRAAAPARLPYAGLPLGAQPSAMFYDAWRQALYLLDGPSQTLVRYKWRGTSGRWAISTAPQSLQAMGPTPDGDHLLVAQPNGDVSLLDADSLTTSSGPFVWARPYTADQAAVGLMALNAAGQSWFRSQGGSLYAFDPLTQVLSSYGGKWGGVYPQSFVVARSGESMMALYRDAKKGASLSTSFQAESELSILLADFLHSLEFREPLLDLYAIADDGHHMLAGFQGIQESNFARVWTDANWDHSASLKWPDSAYRMVGAALAPDGHQAYVLTHPTSDSLPQQSRLYVFDLPTTYDVAKVLAPIGYVDVPGLADCAGSACLSNWPQVLTQVSADGLNLFVAGRQKLLVVPIPQASALVSPSGARSHAASVRATSGSTGKVYRWR